MHNLTPSEEMLVNLINKLLNDEDGISEDAYQALTGYIVLDYGTVSLVFRSLFKQIKTANGRYYLAQDLELINE